MEWEILQSPPATAAENMRKDSELLNALTPASKPLLHFYDWSCKSATYGYFLDPSTQFNLDAVNASGFDIARRPTGGGVIFHLSDLAFSVLIPAGHCGYSLNTLENYRFVNSAVIRAINSFTSGKLTPQLHRCDSKAGSFCMGGATQYDVVVGKKKIAGAAQRKTKAGFLHQGSICLTLPDLEWMRPLLIDGDAVIASMEASSFALTKASEQQACDKEKLQKCLADALSEKLNSSSHASKFPLEN